MADSSKTLRHMLLGKIHRAAVTRADLDYVGSITIDVDLVEKAGFLPNEKVEIYDITNGSRLSTYVIPAARGSGEVGINGAAAHLVKAGDLVIIAAYGWMKEKAAKKHLPRIVHVDGENRPHKVSARERNPPMDPFGHLSARAAGALDQDEEEVGLASVEGEAKAVDPVPTREKREKKKARGDGKTRKRLGGG
jgi:aspartate 1-decarboxylase